MSEKEPSKLEMVIAEIHSQLDHIHQALKVLGIDYSEQDWISGSQEVLEDYTEDSAVPEHQHPPSHVHPKGAE